MKTLVLRVAIVIALVALGQAALWGREVRVVKLASVGDESDSAAESPEVIKAPPARRDYVERSDALEEADGQCAAGPACFGYGLRCGTDCGGYACSAPYDCRDISCCTSAGLFGGAEATFLKPHLGDFRDVELRIPGIGNLATAFGENSYDVSPRFFVGYVSCSGLGVRARYWQFDQTLDAETGIFRNSAQNTLEPQEGANFSLPAMTFVGEGRLNIYALDGEIIQRMDLCSWETTVGFGLRHSNMRHDRRITLNGLLEPDLPVELNLADRSSVIGPTISVDLKRPIGCTGFALVANARGSLLFGTERISFALPNGFPVFFSPVDRTDQGVNQSAPDFLEISGVILPALSGEVKRDITVGVAEIQVGAEWRWKLQNCTQLFVSGLWEAQLWSGYRTLSGGTKDLGMMGASVGVGLMR